jgi:hypothetical protein
MRHVHLTKAKHIHERETHPLVREDVLNKDCDRTGSVAEKEKNSGREPQEAWRQDEPIGGKLPVVK